MANTSTDLVSLDFDALRSSLVSFLSAQPQFRDYDFEGSNLSVLIDLLAYNTHKNAFYMNMLFAEGFLDSAQMRDSVLSHAKELNYVPRSARSAKARISVTFTATGESQPYIIAKGESFSTLVKADAYIFSIPETITVSSANDTFSFETDIYEGIYLKDAYVYKSTLDNQRFRIQNRNVDTTSLSVLVYEDDSLIGTRFNLASTLLDLNETSKVFFLQASENGYFEILFGDGVIGREPKVGSQIVLDYRISADIKPNGASLFTANFEPTGHSEVIDDPIAVTVSNAVDGAPPESIDSVKYYAPRHFQIQERCVVPTDYEISLKTQFPEINAVSVYGGEEVDPPQFGKVFVAIDISDVEGLPNSKKAEYYSFLKARTSLSIDPVFVEPDFTYIALDIWARYNINLTNATRETIRTIIVNAVTDFNLEFLNDFAATLRYSKLIKAIDASDISIVSNVTKVKLYKKILPTLGVTQNVSLDFGVALDDTLSLLGGEHDSTDRSTISSSQFRFNGATVFLEDDANGNIRIAQAQGDKNVEVVKVGTINYAMGTIQLTNFRVDNYDGDSIRVYAVTKDYDVTSPKNTIIGIEADEIKVTTEPLRV